MNFEPGFVACREARFSFSSGRSDGAFERSDAVDSPAPSLPRPLAMNRDLGRKIVGRKIETRIFLPVIFPPSASGSEGPVAAGGGPWNLSPSGFLPSP